MDSYEHEFDVGFCKEVRYGKYTSGTVQSGCGDGVFRTRDGGVRVEVGVLMKQHKTKRRASGSQPHRSLGGSSYTYGAVLDAVQRTQ